MRVRTHYWHVLSFMWNTFTFICLKETAFVDQSLVLSVFEQHSADSTATSKTDYANRMIKFWALNLLNTGDYANLLVRKISLAKTKQRMKEKKNRRKIVVKDIKACVVKKKEEKKSKASTLFWLSRCSVFAYHRREWYCIVLPGIFETCWKPNHYQRSRTASDVEVHYISLLQTLYNILTVMKKISYTFPILFMSFGGRCLRESRLLMCLTTGVLHRRSS